MKTDNTSLEELKKQMAKMKELGFSPVEVTYGEHVLYVMEIPETPPHLTNGKSYLQLTPNQANVFLALIQHSIDVARIDELKLIPWRRADKYGINSPYITKTYYIDRIKQLEENK